MNSNRLDILTVQLKKGILWQGLVTGKLRACDLEGTPLQDFQILHYKSKDGIQLLRSVFLQRIESQDVKKQLNYSFVLGFTKSFLFHLRSL